MPVPGFLSSFADKAQSAINASPLAGHIPGSTRPTSPQAAGSSAGADSGATQTHKSHTLEQIQHQFRTFQQAYSTTVPIQKIITTEKGIALDFDSVNRNAQAHSKELYTWGQNEAPDVRDISDRLAFLNYVSGSLASTLAVKLNAARTPLKSLRDNETALTARRNARAGLQNQIARLEHGQEKGYEKRVAELNDQLAKAERDDEPFEKEHQILIRKSLKESEQLKWEALREYGEKLSLLAQASEPVLSHLPPIPPSAGQPYINAEQTGTIRANLQHALDHWKPGQTTLPPAGASLDRSDTRSFGETHAKELSRLSSPEPRSQSNVPLTPPGTTAPVLVPDVSGKAPPPVHHIHAPPPPINRTPSPVAARKPTSPVPVPGSVSAIDPTTLNNAPAPIPAAASLSAAFVSPDATQPDVKVPSDLPTIAETGVPVSAGADGPGPASGSLRDIKAPLPSFGRSGSVSSSVPASSAPPPAAHFESAEDEKKRLEREEREKVLHGEAAAAASTSAAPTYESAEEEKKRLEREERERLLQGGSGAPEEDKKPDAEGPPPYQDF